MAYNRRNWKGRQGTGLNKFSINGASPVTVVNQPDSLIEAGDALSAGNLNDLETRIDNAFNAVDAEVATKADETEVTNLKNALQATNARVENLEQEHGSYQEVTVKSPYTIPSGKAKNWSVNVLRGVTRAENNQCKNGSFASGDTYWVDNTASTSTHTVTDGVYKQTFTATPPADYNSGILSNGQNISLYAGHTYLIACRFRSSKATYIRGYIAGGGYSENMSVPANTWVQYGGFRTASANNTNASFFINNADARIFSAGDTNEFADVVLRDLTAYFNGTIPSDADTISKIQQNYPELLVPSDYGNSLVSTTYEGVKAEGVNIFDGVMESGAISTSDGQNTSDGTKERSTNYIPTGTYTDLYFTKPMTVFEYDYAKNYITYGDYSSAWHVVLQAGTRYIRFFTPTSSGNEIQICDNNYTDKTTYHPYMTDTLSLPTPITLRSAGTVAEEFDLESGEKTNPLRSINLGDYSWSKLYRSSGNYYYLETALEPTRMPKALSTNAVPNCFCANYLPMPAYGTHAVLENPTKGVNVGYGNGNKAIIIYDPYYDNTDADKDATAFKNAMNGVYLDYELATPDAPTQLVPIQNPYLPTESGGTISSILTDAVDDSMTLGYINL